MGSLNSYENLFEGQNIYVIASGKSLDYLPTSFFEGKITIGANQVFKKFVPTYLLRKEYEMLPEIMAMDLPRGLHSMALPD